MVVDTSEEQAPGACAYVAARALVDMRLAGVNWQTCDVRRAADPVWVAAGNAVLGIRGGRGGMRLPHEIQRMAMAFWQAEARCVHTSDALSEDWIPAAGSSDVFVCQVVRDLHDFVCHRDPVPLRFYIPNTHGSAGRGQHWISVAVSMHVRASAPLSCPSTQCVPQSVPCPSGLHTPRLPATHSTRHSSLSVADADVGRCPARHARVVMDSSSNSSSSESEDAGTGDSGNGVRRACRIWGEDSASDALSSDSEGAGTRLDASTRGAFGCVLGSDVSEDDDMSESDQDFLDDATVESE